MAKIMLVEDDNNLREIYEARLLAEGHEIVSAHDGEEALALAVKERPDLIISDVMMPKISGFDMLDILRSSPETKNTKIIMMTALSQIEDKDRADKLGADRYLVKSQVTLEDVIRVSKEVLEGTSGEPAAPEDPAPVAPLAMAPMPEPVAPAPQPPADPVAPMPVATPPSDTPADTTVPASPATEPNAVSNPSADATSSPIVTASVNDTSSSTTVDEVTTTTLGADTATAEAAAPSESTSSHPVLPASPEAAPAPPVNPLITDTAEVPAAEPETSPAPAAETAVPPAETVPEAPAAQEAATPDLPQSTEKQLEEAPSVANEQQIVAEQVADFVNTPEAQPAPVTIASDGTVTPDVTTEEALAPRQDLVIPPDPLAPLPPADPVAPMPVATPPSDTPADTTVPASPAIEPSEAPGTEAPEPEQPHSTLPSDTSGKKIIQPLNGVDTKPDLNALLAKEEEKEQIAAVLGSAGVTPPPVPTPQPGQTSAPQDDKQDPNTIAL